MRSKINVRFAKGPDGKLVPREYKVGGLFDRELKTIVAFLPIGLEVQSWNGSVQAIERDRAARAERADIQRRVESRTPREPEVLRVVTGV